MMIKMPPKAQIRWQCRRGMLELDILLLSFFESHYDTLSVKEQEAFIKLLEASDPSLYSWLIGEMSAPTVELQNLILLIRGR